MIKESFSTLDSFRMRCLLLLPYLPKSSSILHVSASMSLRVSSVAWIFYRSTIHSKWSRKFCWMRDRYYKAPEGRQSSRMLGQTLLVCLLSISSSCFFKEGLGLFAHIPQPGFLRSYYSLQFLLLLHHMLLVSLIDVGDQCLPRRGHYPLSKVSSSDLCA